jgi:hypothetical protein
MKLKWKLGMAVPAALLIAIAVCWLTMGRFRERVSEWVYFATVETDLAIHPPPARCKSREAEFESRVKRIERNAKNSLKLGTKKSDVIRFFASENIPLAFLEGTGATGTVYVEGDAACRSLACGDDAALVGVRVDVDKNGTVVAEPVVVGMYTDCL